jgi:MFS family permease
MNRRLTRMIRVLLLFEAAMYSAVTPVLPHYQHALHASKPALGLFVAGYPAGTRPGALVGGWVAARQGVRKATIAGLLGFGLAVAGFGLVASLPALDALRVAQGFFCGLIWGGGMTWVIAAADSERRGAAIGGAVGAATLGTLAGPLLGTVAVTVGTGPVFAVVGAISLALAAWARTYPDPEHPPVPGAVLSQLRRALAAGGLGIGFWLTALGAMTFGAANVLLPLRLSHFGAPGWAIGAVFVVASAGSALLSPYIGRTVDRRGARFTLTIGLSISAPLLAVLVLPHSALLLGIVAVVALGGPLTACFIPSVTLMTHATERAAVSLIFATTAMNVAFATGEMIGAPAAAGISQATGDWVPLVLIGALMLASVPLLRRGAVMRATAGDGEADGALHRAGGATPPDAERDPGRGDRRRADLPDRAPVVRVGPASPTLCDDSPAAGAQPAGAAERS